MKTILVTGSQGFLGSALCPYLFTHNYHVVGLDAGWFADCRTGPATVQCEQHTCDVRDVGDGIFKGVDAVVHLAALCNDALGEMDPELTVAINYYAALDFANRAKAAGVKRFVFVSSQSIYGVSDGLRELYEEDLKHPASAYAKAKWFADEKIRTLSDDRFCAVALRPATVYGPSPRTRCDVVLNNLVASGVTEGVVKVDGDGSAWRPVVSLLDLCRAVVLTLEAPHPVVGGKAYNVTGGNYTVGQLAAVAAEATGTRPVYGDKGADPRSYRTSAHRILTDLAWAPGVSALDGAKQMAAFYRHINLTAEQFRGQTCNRLARLKELAAAGVLDAQLRSKP